MMTVAIGMNITSGPYGGGNQFAASLTKYLQRLGIHVVNTLADDAIDVMLVTEPRRWHNSSSFDIHQARHYQLKYKQGVIVLRVNECDERKGRNNGFLNRAIIAATRSVDHTVFISQWLQHLYLSQEPTLINRSSVILNGADREIFYRRPSSRWRPGKTLSIVTHHWSDNLNKGWDVYAALDRLSESKIASPISFTYIGNVPAGQKLLHSTHIPPLSGSSLARELSKHHVYLSASRNEPAGMHHIEAGVLGLPLLYLESGALPEYCRNYGIPFQGARDLTHSINLLIAHYPTLMRGIRHYPHTADKMSQSYLHLFTKLLDNNSFSEKPWTLDVPLASSLFALRLVEELRSRLHQGRHQVRVAA
jgi:hypothetical protein